MEGAILSGQLAAKAVADSYVNAASNDQSAVVAPPRQLTPRPADPSAADAHDVVPDRTMYVAKVASHIPASVQEELEGAVVV
jgi:hypothetical protein